MQTTDRTTAATVGRGSEDDLTGTSFPSAGSTSGPGSTAEDKDPLWPKTKGGAVTSLV